MVHCYPLVAIHCFESKEMKKDRNDTHIPFSFSLIWGWRRETRLLTHLHSSVLFYCIVPATINAIQQLFGDWQPLSQSQFYICPYRFPPSWNHSLPVKWSPKIEFQHLHDKGYKPAQKETGSDTSPTWECRLVWEKVVAIKSKAINIWSAPSNPWVLVS